jgi:hypothetical protein
VKAATAENEVQFVETNDRNVAKILFPGIASQEQFLGLVKSEPEKFEKFGKYLLQMFRCFPFVHHLHFCLACHDFISNLIIEILTHYSKVMPH